MGSRDAIAAHANKLLEKITSGANNTETLPDVTAATANAAVPSFSTGTVALDPNERREAAALESPPTALDQAASAIPIDAEDAETGAAAQAAASGKEAGAQPRERDASGKFKSDTPAPVAAPKPAKKPKAVSAPVAEAEAEAAVDDDWAEVEDLIFEHDDGSKYPVRTPKKFAKQVERFNRRQAMVNRAQQYLGRYQQILEPLITTGRLEGILPHIQRALNDPEFAEYVNQGYNRRLIGQPLNQATQVVDQPTPGQISPAAANVPTAESLGISDPFVAEAVAPLVQNYQQLFARLNAMEQQQQTVAQQQQQQAAQRAQQEAQLSQAHEDLSRQFPAIFNASLKHNDPEWQRVWRFANDGGYFQNTNDLRLAARVAARDYLDSRAETYSPAAELLAQGERASLRGAAAQAAAARSVGGGSPSHTPKPAPKPIPKPPSVRTDDGKRKNPREYMAEAQRYAAELAAAGS